MLQDISDYLKCAAKNRLTLSGYLLSGLAGALIARHDNSANITGYLENACTTLSMIAGPMLLILTDCGKDTFKVYRRVKRHIGLHKKIDHRVVERYKDMYCTYVGMELAAKESGLEKSIKRVL